MVGANRLYLERGQKIGLLGGSFDPPHRGHVHISREAIKRFGLDRVIWLVSPGNPLKPDAPAALAKRLQAARALAPASQVIVSDYEAQQGTRFTADTLHLMQRTWPGVKFVWLMGADNLTQIHKWDNWHSIFATVPIGILARPGERIAARLSPAARIYRKARLSGRASHLLPDAVTPKWCFVNISMMDISSTALRHSGSWSR